MTNIDVFNGDADGICSLIQLHHARPRSSQLVTGVKRDIQLLDRVTAVYGDQVTVLDISLEKNITALHALCQAGTSVWYADHHRAIDIPHYDNLTTLINQAPNICTGLIIDNYLDGQYRDWAITAAFGDNLTQVAEELCLQNHYSEKQITTIRQLGVVMNYNAYGDSIEDLWLDPAQLFRLASPYTSPFDFIVDQTQLFDQLIAGYEQDLAQGLAVNLAWQTDTVAVLILPDAPWARRISGVLGNELANRYPERAHAICTERSSSNDYQVSLRAAKTISRGAGDIAIQFGGGGRAGAAGIHQLAKHDFDRLIEAMQKQWAQ